MAMLSPGGGSRRGRRRSLNAEINVTPFVDVMLVLLIVFMITAPLLAQGVDVNLPKTRAALLPPTQEQPLTVTVDAAGSVFVMKEEVALEDMITKLEAVARTGYEETIFIRLDETVPSGTSVDVMARIQQAGFRKISILTDPKSR